jgi:hypothetical protein
MAYDSLVADPAVAFIQIFNDSMSAVMFVLRYMDESMRLYSLVNKTDKAILVIWYNAYKIYEKV